MKKFFENTDILLAAGVILILGLMIIPLPPFMLDFLLAVNISMALLVLIVSLYINKPLDISIFPGLLLVLTLFRLGLNISSTRLILLNGYAGKIIETFGSFVVGGSYVVGFIIFLILVIINFVVIVKGATRISEVAARFTLDAMPGKQMAIDADLNSGIITEDEARQRREDIKREAEFYGAMDGASKFVKGDAIAGLIINAINIVGGLIIGVVQLGMPIKDALQTYTILTIGDGLVSQIPALIISVSAGMVVTKNAEGDTMDKQMRLQLFNNPRVLGVVAGAIMQPPLLRQSPPELPLPAFSCLRKRLQRPPLRR
jgi:flagellar biosynthesis protein FlhA